MSNVTKILALGVLSAVLVALGLTLFGSKTPNAQHMDSPARAASASDTAQIAAKRRDGQNAESTGHTTVPASDFPEDRWDREMAGLSPADRQKFEDFAKNYPDYYSGLSPAMQNWMIRHGYPSPAQIARAASMSDQELRDEAWAGDDISAELLTARILNRSMHYRDELAANGMSSEDIQKDQKYLDTLAPVGTVRHRLIGSCSPFAAILGAQWARLSLVSPYGELGYLEAARQLGEQRTTPILYDYLQTMGLSEGVFMGMMTYGEATRGSRESPCGVVEQSP